MRIKNNIYRICLTMILWLMLAKTSMAQSHVNKTTWSIADQGMDELLTSGWKIVGHSISRSILFPGTVNAREEERFSYILSKGNKSIQCIIDNPQLNRSYSLCRYLN